MSKVEIRTYFRKKGDCIREIYKMEQKYDVDYLMRWSKKNLINYYTSLKYKRNRETEKQERSYES